MRRALARFLLQRVLPRMLYWSFRQLRCDIDFSLVLYDQRRAQSAPPEACAIASSGCSDPLL